MTNLPDKIEKPLLELVSWVVDFHKGKTDKTLGEILDEAKAAIIKEVDEDSLEAAIKQCGYGFRSLSLHSDGRWIAKSGANTGKFLVASRLSPQDAVRKLKDRLEGRE